MCVYVKQRACALTDSDSGESICERQESFYCTAVHNQTILHNVRPVCSCFSVSVSVNGIVN